ncbi:helix-turn-helix transcriptional regulator [Clostridium frigidicarnis]|uniref:Helix-turn-helix n=1 Tax=Clostridium frigidicarnis TaxID=84698 RepID=A0A1I0YST9_9CLOT|nr:helix-turn-helix transcriptional regulator [Clostridium frigidicarnis]SFB15510.1 Helix-turn-helix [Clostridium frigidicarnis]
MSRVGEKIKIAREESKMTQKQLAKKLGVAESFINELELGRKIANEQVLQRISKALNKNVNDIGMSFESEVFKEEKAPSYSSIKKDKSKDGETKDIWNQAFGDVLRNVPIYKYDLRKAIGYRELPVHSNKIEGFAQDKVMFLEIENDEMLGYRMQKGDIAFCHSIKEIENNSLCFIEYNGIRAVRYIKRLDNSKLLILSNKGTMQTETVYIKEVTPIAKLLKLEIKL